MYTAYTRVPLASCDESVRPFTSSTAVYSRYGRVTSLAIAKFRDLQEGKSYHPVLNLVMVLSKVLNLGLECKQLCVHTHCMHVSGYNIIKLYALDRRVYWQKRMF